MPEPDAMFTMAPPPRSSMAGMAYRLVRAKPRMLTAKISSHRVMSMSTTSVSPTIAAGRVSIIGEVLRPEDQYHAGIVVADLDAALEKLTAIAGYQFADEYKGDNLVRTPAGESLVSMRFAYSLGPAPLIEVIQQCPGTV